MSWWSDTEFLSRKKLPQNPKGLEFCDGEPILFQGWFFKRHKSKSLGTERYVIITETLFAYYDDVTNQQLSSGKKSYRKSAICDLAFACGPKFLPGLGVITSSGIDIFLHDDPREIDRFYNFLVIWTKNKNIANDPQEESFSQRRQRIQREITALKPAAPPGWPNPQTYTGQLPIVAVGYCAPGGIPPYLYPAFKSDPLLTPSQIACLESSRLLIQAVVEMPGVLSRKEYRLVITNELLLILNEDGEEILRCTPGEIEEISTLEGDDVHNVVNPISIGVATGPLVLTLRDGDTKRLYPSAIGSKYWGSALASFMGVIPPKDCLYSISQFTETDIVFYAIDKNIERSTTKNKKPRYSRSIISRADYSEESLRSSAHKYLSTTSTGHYDEHHEGTENDRLYFKDDYYYEDGEFLTKDIHTSGDNDHATHSLTPSSGAVPANTDKTADEDTDSEEYLDLFGNYDLLVPYDLQESDSETSKDEGVEASDKYQEKHVVSSGRAAAIATVSMPDDQATPIHEAPSAMNDRLSAKNYADKLLSFSSNNPTESSTTTGLKYTESRENLADVLQTTAGNIKTLAISRLEQIPSISGSQCISSIPSVANVGSGPNAVKQKRQKRFQFTSKLERRRIQVAKQNDKILYDIETRYHDSSESESSTEYYSGSETESDVDLPTDLARIQEASVLYAISSLRYCFVDPDRYQTPELNTWELLCPAYAPEDALIRAGDSKFAVRFNLPDKLKRTDEAAQVRRKILRGYTIPLHEHHNQTITVKEIDEAFGRTDEFLEKLEVILPPDLDPALMGVPYPPHNIIDKYSLQARNELTEEYNKSLQCYKEMLWLSSFIITTEQELLESDDEDSGDSEISGNSSSSAKDQRQHSTHKRVLHNMDSIPQFDYGKKISTAEEYPNSYLLKPDHRVTLKTVMENCPTYFEYQLCLTKHYTIIDLYKMLLWYATNVGVYLSRKLRIYTASQAISAACIADTVKELEFDTVTAAAADMMILDSLILANDADVLIDTMVSTAERMTESGRERNATEIAMSGMGGLENLSVQRDHEIFAYFGHNLHIFGANEQIRRASRLILAVFISRLETRLIQQWNEYFLDIVSIDEFCLAYEKASNYIKSTGTEYMEILAPQHAWHLLGLCFEIIDQYALLHIKRGARLVRHHESLINKEVCKIVIDYSSVEKYFNFLTLLTNTCGKEAVESLLGNSQHLCAAQTSLHDSGVDYVALKPMHELTSCSWEYSCETGIFRFCDRSSDSQTVTNLGLDNGMFRWRGYVLERIRGARPDFHTAISCFAIWLNAMILFCSLKHGSALNLMRAFMLETTGAYDKYTDVTSKLLTNRQVVDKLPVIIVEYLWGDSKPTVSVSVNNAVVYSASYDTRVPTVVHFYMMLYPFVDSRHVLSHIPVTAEQYRLLTYNAPLDAEFIAERKKEDAEDEEGLLKCDPPSNRPLINKEIELSFASKVFNVTFNELDTAELTESTLRSRNNDLSSSRIQRESRASLAISP